MNMLDDAADAGPDRHRLEIAGVTGAATTAGGADRGTFDPAALAASAGRHYVRSNVDLTHAEPVLMARGDGVYVIDVAGRRYLEGLAGLWCTGLGFSEPRLAQAAERQLRTLPYYHNFAGRAAAVTVDLAERLAVIAPAPLTRAMFASSGSEANDLAVKTVWYYNNALGRPVKKKIIAHADAYHGVTVMSGSLTGLPGTHGGFDLPRPGVVRINKPHHYRYARPDEDEAAFARRLAMELEATIAAEGADTIAAMIAEPVMGAGGVVPPPAGYFALIQPILRRHDILLIADEVICGFGRTGAMFGCETYGIAPDLMTVAKQLTSGYVPMSAVMMSDAVHSVVAAESSRRGVFGHGYTYAGHPLGAAVALEVLNIYAERDLLGHAARVGRHLRARLSALAGHPAVGEVRAVGMLAGVQLVADKAERRFHPAETKAASRVVAEAQRRGLIVRALPGDAIGICPPLIVTEEELDVLVDTLTEALDVLTATP